MFTKCSSPVAFTQLSDGTWLFEVQATSAQGVTDPTPATAQFTVDTVPPSITAPAALSIPVGEQLQPDGTLGVRESWVGHGQLLPVLRAPVQRATERRRERVEPWPVYAGTFLHSFQNLAWTTASTHHQHGRLDRLDDVLGPRGRSDRSGRPLLWCDQRLRRSEPGDRRGLRDRLAACGDRQGARHSSM
jgi:hypothetical protein